MSRRTLAMLLIAAVGARFSPDVRGADGPRGGGPAEENGGDEELFGLDKLWEFHLKIEADAWDEMQPPSRPGAGPFGGGGGLDIDFKYVKGTLEFGGKTYREVGVRYKGHGSYAVSSRGTKRPFKIDLDRHIKKQTIAGQAKLNLANNVMDPSFTREALAYAVFRRAGVPAPRTAFVKLYLTVPGKFDRTYLGLYTLDEQVDKRFLRAHFGEADGLLLKPQNTRGLPHLGEEWSAYEKPYEPKTDARPAHKKRLIEFTRLVNDRGEGADEAFREQIGSFLDVDEFLRFLAVNAALANLDSFLVLGKNCYIYLDPETNKFVFIPWDLDISFGGFTMVGPADTAGRPEHRPPPLGREPADRPAAGDARGEQGLPGPPRTDRGDGHETGGREGRHRHDPAHDPGGRRGRVARGAEAVRTEPVVRDTSAPSRTGPSGVREAGRWHSPSPRSCRSSNAGWNRSDRSSRASPRAWCRGSACSGGPAGLRAASAPATSWPPWSSRPPTRTRTAASRPRRPPAAAERFVRDADSAKKGSIDLDALRDAMNRRMAPPPGFGGPGGPPGGPPRRPSGEPSRKEEERSAAMSPGSAVGADAPSDPPDPPRRPSSRTRRRASAAVLTDQGQEQVVVRVGMPEVLSEGLGLRHPDLGAPVGAPLLLAVEIFVDAVLPQEPVALAGMAGEHLPLELEDARHVDVEARRLWPAVAVLALDGVDVIEVGDSRQGGAGSHCRVT